MHIYTDEIERLRGSIVTRGWGKKNCGRFRGSIVKWICCSISTMGGGGEECCIGVWKRGKCDYRRANKLKVYSYGGHLFVCVPACLTGKSFWLQI